MANICVFCASRPGTDPIYKAVAEETGTLLGSRHHTLVYGGGNLGMMGFLARATQKAGGSVIGIVPHVFSEMAEGEDELVRAENLRHRITIMEQRSDAYITLPGGFGTLHEQHDVLVAQYLSAHKKPNVIVNSNGFYDNLLAHYEQLFENGLAATSTRSHYHVVKDPMQAVDLVEKLLHK